MTHASNRLGVEGGKSKSMIICARLNGPCVVFWLSMYQYVVMSPHASSGLPVTGVGELTLLIPLPARCISYARGVAWLRRSCGSAPSSDEAQRGCGAARRPAPGRGEWS